jgi:hypothetical protein
MAGLLLAGFMIFLLSVSVIGLGALFFSLWVYVLTPQAFLLCAEVLEIVALSFFAVVVQVAYAQAFKILLSPQKETETSVLSA